MDLIEVDHVVEAVMDYYDKELLPPIGDPKGNYPPIEAITEPSGEQETFKVDSDAEAPPEIWIPKVEIRRATPIGKSTPRLIRDPSVESKQQRPHQQIHPEEASTQKQDTPTTKSIIPNIDNPIIGGSFTIFVLCYGNHVELARRCIGSIMESVPLDRIDLRVGGNELGNETLEYLHSLPITKTYLHADNAKKYPLMREMLWDPKCPIKSPYMIWFDDDAHVVDPRWLTLLSNSIISGHNDGYRMYGSMMFHDINAYNKEGHRPDTWFREADWYNGVSLRTRGGKQLAHHHNR